MISELSELSSAFSDFWSNRYQTQASKRLKLHAELREGLVNVPEALREMDELLTAETEAFVTKEQWLLRRRFNGHALFWGLVLSLATVPALFFALLWALQGFQAWSHGGSWLLFLLVSIGCGALIGAPLGMAAVAFKFMYGEPQATPQTPPAPPQATQ